MPGPRLVRYNCPARSGLSWTGFSRRGRRRAGRLIRRAFEIHRGLKLIERFGRETRVDQIADRLQIRALDPSRLAQPGVCAQHGPDGRGESITRREPSAELSKPRFQRVLDARLRAQACRLGAGDVE